MAPKPTRSDGYHHGDLRRVLLEATVALVKDEGVDAVSLREVARRAGVSPAAPYHHFADKTALLAAVAEAGFTELGGRIATAVSKAGSSPVARLTALERAYLAFAFEQPAYYRVMHSPAVNQAATEGPLCEISRTVFDVLCQLVAEVKGVKRIDRAVRLDAALVWAGGHGLAGLINDGLLERKLQLGSNASVAKALSERLAGWLATPA